MTHVLRCQCLECWKVGRDARDQQHFVEVKFLNMWSEPFNWAVKFSDGLISLSFLCLGPKLKSRVAVCR